MSFLRAVFRSTLNNVLFGIALMVLVGAYIAIGSGLPRVREAFEMNELQFFNAWPLKVLAGLLVLNLSVVTWCRIPLTLPRAGVWMIHAGIITLVLGMGFYYHFKIEGQIYIHQGQTVGGFYDGSQRSLFIRANGTPVPTSTQMGDWMALPTLPRFKDHLASAGQTAIDPSLANLPLVGLMSSEDGQLIRRSVGEALGLPNDIAVDVVAYRPYAHVSTDYTPDDASKIVGLQLSMSDPHSGKTSQNWLVDSDPTARVIDLGGVSIEHRHVPPPGGVDRLLTAAMAVHTLDVHVGDVTQTLHVQVGQSYDVPGTSYHLKIENYDPAFPMSGTGEVVKILTMLVTNDKPAAGVDGTFRRMTIDGKPLQTDFKLDPAGAAPMGKRQKAPLDTALQIDYTFNDPQHVIDNDDGNERHILITGDKPGISQIVLSPQGAVSIVLMPADGTIRFGGADLPITLHVQKFDHLRRDTQVADVPVEKRTREEGASGLMQVITLRVHSGDWQQIVDVPFVPLAMEADAGWSTVPTITLPGTAGSLQLALGNTRRPLPARLTLEKFELVSYPGGTPNDNLFRDFKSTLRVVDPRTGEQETAVAHMNSPIYFQSGNWLFFQAGYNKQEMATFIGVGNRPGVGVMITGCVMMAIGLMWAFYIKPIIISRRKRAALMAAQSSGKLKRREPAAVV